MRVKMNDFKTQCAVLQQIIVLGGAAKHSHVPWHDIAGMRDRCVLGYDEVELATKSAERTKNSRGRESDRKPKVAR